MSARGNPEGDGTEYVTQSDHGVSGLLTRTVEISDAAVFREFADRAMQRGYQEYLAHPQFGGDESTCCMPQCVL
jgi:hypothetical protein